MEERALALLNALLYDYSSKSTIIGKMPLLDFQDVASDDKEFSVRMECLRQMIRLRRKVSISHPHLIQCRVNVRQGKVVRRNRDRKLSSDIQRPAYILISYV